MGEAEAVSVINKYRKDRASRLQEPRSGAWGTASQDFISLCALLFEHSFQYSIAKRINSSPYVLAALPLFFSVIRTLLIERNSWPPCNERLGELAKGANDLEFLKKYYDIPDNLFADISILYEIRNEIAHPSHMPAGTLNNTPQLFFELREKGLLQSTGNSEADYIWIDQLQSHRLFEWAFSVIRETAKIIYHAHMPAEQANKFLASYG